METTIEQKVMKKAKSMDKLKYNKGIAFVILSITEDGTEYTSNFTNKVRIYFKTKAAIKRIGDALGGIKFNKKQTLLKFEKGINYQDVVMTEYEMMVLKGAKNIQKDIVYSYENSYAGGKFSTILDPRKPLTYEQRDYYIGSVADGEPLTSYFEYLQNSILDGTVQYIV